MTTIKAFRERQYYHSKYGEKLYLDSEDGNTAIKAAIITGKGLKTEEELVYTAAGEDEHEANTALKNYLKSISFNGIISRTEITDNDYPIQDETWPSRRWNKERTDYIDLSGTATPVNKQAQEQEQYDFNIKGGGTRESIAIGLRLIATALDGKGEYPAQLDEEMNGSEWNDCSMVLDIEKSK